MTVSACVFSSATVEWETPKKLFTDLDRRFHFTLDVCATPENAKCENFFTKDINGLAQSWEGQRCWMNPPYGKDIGLWCEKAMLEAQKGALVVGLLPARVDTRYWKKYVEPHADLRFIQGRLSFGDVKGRAPFPSAIAIWWGWAVVEGAFSKVQG